MKKRTILPLLLLALAIVLVSGLWFMNEQRVSAAVKFQATGLVEGEVIANALNMRQGPSTNYPVINVLRKGQRVKVFGQVDDWYAVYDYSRGNVGAVHSKYIKVHWPQSTPKQPTPTPTPTPKPEEPAPTPTPTPPADTTPGDISPEEQRLLDLVNKARADAGVGPLKFDAELMKVARLKAKDMVENNYFSHNSPTYGSPFDMMRQFGIEFKSAGENIAGNQTVDAAFKAWMNSEGHRKNILNGKFNYTGIGIVDSPTYGKIFVQMFIGR